MQMPKYHFRIDGLTTLRDPISLYLSGPEAARDYALEMAQTIAGRPDLGHGEVQIKVTRAGDGTYFVVPIKRVGGVV